MRVRIEDGNVVSQHAVDQPRTHVGAPARLTTRTSTLPSERSGVNADDSVQRTPEGLVRLQPQTPHTQSGSQPSTQAWQTILSDGFEGNFPGPWRVSANAGFTSAYWDDENVRANSGRWSAWCAGDGASAAMPGGQYRNNMQAWMEYGPFDLSDAHGSVFSFYYWNDSELNYDYLYWLVSINGTNYTILNRVSGSSGGWIPVTVDLGNVPTHGDLNGQPRVWIAFCFMSDGNGTGLGAFVDDVMVRKDTGVPDLVPHALSFNIDPEFNDWYAGSTTLTVQYQERNDGSLASPSHYSQLFLDNGGPRWHLANLTVPPIAAGAVSTIVQIDAMIPSNIPDGTYDVKVDADVNGAIEELDESNNLLPYVKTARIVSGRPDLEWTSISCTPTGWNWRAGETRSITLTERNTGVRAATQHTTRIFLSRDGSTPIATLCEATFPLTIGANGQSASHTFPQFQVPSLPDGTYYIGAIVDVYDVVREENEENNGGFTDPIVILTNPEPDVQVTAASPNSTAWTTGTSITVTISETNLGAGTAPAHTTRLYLSTTPGGNEVALDGAFVSFGVMTTMSNQSRACTFSPAQTLAPGQYYLVALAEIQDANSANNRYVHPVLITVSRPLAVTAPTGGENWQVGSMQTIRWTGSGTTCVTIEYTTNGGATWLPIVNAHTTSTGSYTWAVPATPSSTCRVRVRDCTNAALSAESNSFAITAQGRLWVGASAIDFGSTTTNAGVTRMLTVRNDGTAAVSLRNFSIEGAHAAYFSRTSSASELLIGPSQTMDIELKFLPTIPGSKSGELRFTSTDPTAPGVVVRLTGQCQAGSGGLELVQSSITFEHTPVGNSSQVRDIRIRNTGTSDLIIWDQHLEGDASHFVTVMYAKATLAPQESVVLSFMFKPSELGSKYARFKFQTTDPASPVGTIHLYGNGIVNSIEQVDGVAKFITVSQNHPNPFSGSTFISYALSEDANVTITVYDTRGRVIMQEDRGQRMRGVHMFDFDAAGLPAGIYRCVLTANGTSATVNMHLVR